MMSDKIQIELQEIIIAQLLEHAMVGMQETGEYTPAMASVYKELASKLPDSAWNAQAIKEFADSLDDSIDGADEDYSFTLESLYDEDDY